MVRAGIAASVVVALSGCATNRGLPETAPALADVGVCQQTTVPLYFQEGSDRLTPIALQTLAAATQPLRGCRIREVVVVGLTQGAPTPANQQLSENRALQVTRALGAQGMPAPRVEAFAGGAPGSTEPMQRRTEVVVFAERP